MRSELEPQYEHDETITHPSTSRADVSHLSSCMARRFLSGLRYSVKSRGVTGDLRLRKSLPILSGGVYVGKRVSDSGRLEVSAFETPRAFLMRG